MELETAARRRLLDLPGVTGYVGDKVWKHGQVAPIEGTGGLAVIVGRGPEWAKPDRVQTSEFPTLDLTLLADPTRDADGNVTTADAHDKALALHRVIDPELHAARGQRWGAVGSLPGLMVVSCVRWSEPVLRGPAERAFEHAVAAVVSYAIHMIH